MTDTITITINKKEKERLNQLAIRYGFSVQEFSRRILKELTSDIPEESLSEYRNPKKVRESIERAIRDWKTGKIHHHL